MDKPIQNDPREEMAYILEKYKFTIVTKVTKDWKLMPYCWWPEVTPDFHFFYLWGATDSE